jgi:hypothetical protein
VEIRTPSFRLQDGYAASNTSQAILGINRA